MSLVASLDKILSEKQIQRRWSDCADAQAVLRFCCLQLSRRQVLCALWSPAGKGLTSWLSFVVSSVSLSLSHWYPGSGVVLDCIDS